MYKQYLIIAGWLLSFAACGNPDQADMKTIAEAEQKQEKDTLFIFYLYGELAPYNYLDEQDSLLTKPLGFVLKRAAYCEVDEPLMDSVIRHNQEMQLRMMEKYGKDWIEKVEAAIDKKLLIPFENEIK